jgi:hypothetical protein
LWGDRVLEKTASATARKIVFKRLNPGGYLIRIAAQNAIGTSLKAPGSRFASVEY